MKRRTFKAYRWRPRTFGNNKKKPRISFFVHILEYDRYDILKLITEGKIEGKSVPVRRQMTWLRNIKEWTELDFQALIRKVQDTNDFTEVIPTSNKETLPKQKYLLQYFH